MEKCSIAYFRYTTAQPPTSRRRMLSPTLRWPTAGHRSFSAFTRLDSAPPCWLHGIAALLSPAFARLLDLPKCSHNTRAKAGRDQHEKKGLVRKRAHKCWNAVTVSVSVGNSCLHPSSEANSTSRQNRKHNDDNGDSGSSARTPTFARGFDMGKLHQENAECVKLM